MNETKFTIEHHSMGEIKCLKIQGYLDAHTAPQLESALGNLVQDGKHKIIVNFSELDYISSAGLGVFMVYIEDVRASGGDIKLSEMKPKVFTVFDLLGFPMLFEILESNHAAIAKFDN